MKWYRIWAMVVRHLTQLPTDFNKLSSIIYWPLIDIVLFGFVGIWMSKGKADTSYAAVLVSGIVIWQIVNRSSLSVSLNLLEELWSRNITNLFATPLSIGEWIMSVVVEGVLVTIALFLLCFGIVYLIYGFSLFVLGWWLIPLIILAFISGLSIGLISGSCIFYWGQRVQSLVWMAGWAFAVFSGAFYPIAVLPYWMQKAAYCLPLSYIFTAIQKIILAKETPVYELATGMSICIPYFVFSIALFSWTFFLSKKRGLARLMD